MAPISTHRFETLPDLSSKTIRKNLARRTYPYWHPLTGGRFVGYTHPTTKGAYWVARYRRRDGLYRQKRIGEADDFRPADGTSILSFDQARAAALAWFSGPEVAPFSGNPTPLGRTRGLLYSPIGEMYTLGHALRDYLAWKRLSSAETHFDIIVSLINYHILPRLGPLAVDELEAEHFRSYFQEVMETPPKRGNRPTGSRQPMSTLDDDALRKRKKTVNALIVILRDTLQRAWEDGKTDNDRLWRSLRNLPNVDRPRMLHLSRRECRMLLKACRPDLRNLVLGALYTGCRSLELLRMRVLDVGHDGYGVYVVPSKTRKSRFVFLPDEGMAFFLQLARGRPAQEYLFLRGNSRPWGEYHRQIFKKAALRCGLPPDLSFHCLRHTYASQLVQAGAPLTVVADQLGHVNTVTVSRTYGHISPQIRESEVRQRFTTLSPGNARTAEKRKRALARWRAGMRGNGAGDYAKIKDLKSARRTLH